MSRKKTIGRVIVTHHGQQIVSDILAIRGYGVTCWEAGESNGSVGVVTGNLKAHALNAPKMAKKLADPGFKFQIELGGELCEIDEGFDLHGRIWDAWRDFVGVSLADGVQA